MRVYLPLLCDIPGYLLSVLPIFYQQKTVGWLMMPSSASFAAICLPELPEAMVTVTFPLLWNEPL